jgi:peptidoglycan hydrolase CwlO-like protein
MSAIRRLLGIFVMFAGILGLVLSLAGLVGIWVIKPTLAAYADTTIATLNTSIATSQQVMKITGEALGATVDSVDALSEMLGTTAKSVEDTQPVFDQVNTIMGETLPATLGSATESLKTAQQAASVLDSAIKSLDTFRFVLSAVPLVGSFVEQPTQPYNPEVPLADSLGSLAKDLEGLPATFSDMAVNLDKADDNLALIQSNLNTMSGSVALISKSLGEYQAMIAQSQSSMENLSAMLTNIQNNLDSILNTAAVVITLFFVWLLTAQIVIFSQGLELYRGTAGRMESTPEEPQPAAEA